MNKLNIYCRRSFAWLLAVALCAGLMPNTALAAEMDGSETTAVEVVVVDVSSSDSASTSDSTDRGSNDSADTGGSAGTSDSTDTGSNDSAGTSDSTDTGSSDSAGTSDSTDTGSSDSTDTGSSDSTDTGDSAGTNDSADTGSSDTSAEHSSNTYDNAGMENSVDTNSNTETEDTENTNDDGSTESSDDSIGDMDVSGSPAEEGNPDSDGSSAEDMTAVIPGELYTDSETEGSSKTAEKTAADFSWDAEADSSMVDEGDAQIVLLNEEDENDSEDFDLTKTERPDQSDTVNVTIGDTESADKTRAYDWSVFYDAKRDVYKLTFNIGEDAEGDQVIDLTYALKLLTEYAGDAKNLEKDPNWNNILKEMEDEDYIDHLTQKEADVLQPGDIRKFEIYLTSDSKHTYKYKEGSFTLATADLEKWSGSKADSGVTSFDGQELPDFMVGQEKYALSMRSEPIIKLLSEELGIPERDIRQNMVSSYDKRQISKFLNSQEGGAAGYLEQYLLTYYGEKDNTEYRTFNELIQSNKDALKELTGTSSDRHLQVDNKDITLDVDLKDFTYNNFYQNLLSFVYGSEEDIDAVTGTGTLTGGMGAYWYEPERWEYKNDSWTSRPPESLDPNGQGYEAALYYYMAHEEIWEETDRYFQQLLDGGLKADQAIWPSFMMALNIDGEMTGNKWQDTIWPWYNSIQMERVDIDFSLTKVDEETGDVIADSETGFQIYYIDTVKDEFGEEKTVNMYCTYDENTNSYTFVPTASTVWTKKGQLDISYALLKDIVYYLQEVVAPEGYELDTTVYVIMDKDKYNPEDFPSDYVYLGGADGNLKLNVKFVNTKKSDEPDKPEKPGKSEEPEKPEKSDNKPERPERPEQPSIPEEVIPQMPVPLANIPDEEIPLAYIIDEDVPLAGVPRTGDTSGVWYAMTLLSACCLLVVEMLDRKKHED